jgi:hypothetical protein
VTSRPAPSQRSRQGVPVITAPRLEAACSKHGTPLPLCDACATIPVMSAWASALSGYALADALETLARDTRYYSPAERGAVLIEAARRVRP